MKYIKIMQRLSTAYDITYDLNIYVYIVINEKSSFNDFLSCRNI